MFNLNRPIMKKATSLLLFCLALSAAHAQNPNLIDISTPEQLNAIRYDLSGDGTVDDDIDATAYSDAFGTPNCPDGCAGFELTANIDLTGVTWEPILRNGNGFEATFNGNGYTISNLSVSVSADDVGMFGFIEEEGVIRNLGLEKVSVTNTRVGRFVDTGGLAGRNSGLIIGCYVTGTVTGSGTVGGLVGTNRLNVIASYSQAEVVGVDVAEGARLGGLVGLNSEETISTCYATGDVTSESTARFSRGGLVGVNVDGATITTCYSTGRVTDSGSGNRGGLVGTNADVDQGDRVENSYFDSVTAGLSEAIGGGTGPTTNVSAQTTAELQSPTGYTDLFADWNLDIDEDVNPGLEDGSAAGDDTTDSPWDFGTDSEYPALSIDFDGDGSASAYEFGVQGRPRPPLPNTLNPNLIDVGSFDQLDAIRYDLDGDGSPSGSSANRADYRMAFGLTGSDNNTCPGGCTGFELTTNLDLAPNLADAGETWTPIGSSSVFRGHFSTEMATPSRTYP